MSTLAIDTIQGATTATSVDMSGVTSLQMPTGHIIQTLSSTKLTAQGINSSSFVDVTDLSVAITPFY